MAERTGELTALLEISREMTATLELPALVDITLECLKDMVEYESGFMVSFRGDARGIVGLRGLRSFQEALSTPLSAEELVAHEEIARLGQPVIVPDLQEEDCSPRLEALRRGRLAEQRLFGCCRSLLGVPLLGRDGAIGMTWLANSRPHAFEPHHAGLALTIANHAAVSMENARLYADAQGAAALEERQHLARELHDSVSEALYGISLGAHTLEELRERDPAQASETIRWLISLADAALMEMRALIFELRPESLAREGLVAALAKQAAFMEARHHIEVETELGPEPDLPLQAKEALYRIAQETLELYQAGVEAGRRALGEAFFENPEYVDKFWAILETRPFMRALEGVAGARWAVGQTEQAVADYRELLRLNPDDN